MDWIFDDGATDHYCGNYELLKNSIKLKKPPEVKTASQVVRATHQGCVEIRLENGQCLILKCWYLPHFNINLVLRHKLSLMGFKSVFDSETQNWYFTDGNIKGTTTNINGVQ